jgi:hypothetical protein
MLLMLMDCGANGQNTQKALATIKQYKFTSQCFVGKPNRTMMMYFLTENNNATRIIPGGLFSGVGHRQDFYLCLLF